MRGANPYGALAACAVLAALWLAAPSLASAPGEDSVPPLLENYLDAVSTLSADFVQTLIDPDGELLESSRGTLSISRPGRFRWIYEQPYEQWLIADGLNLWSYDADLAQVTVKPQAEALASTPALLLGGSREVLEQFRYEETTSEGGLTWLRLVPLDPDSGFRYMELGFEGERLSRMLFLDNLEQTTVVALENPVVNEPIDAAVFVFEVPADADVVGTATEPPPGRD